MMNRNSVDIVSRKMGDMLRGVWLYGEKEAMDYGEQMGVEIVGVSGDLSIDMSFNSSGLRQFADAVEKRCVQILLVHDLSRFGRNMSQVLMYLEQL